MKVYFRKMEEKTYCVIDINPARSVFYEPLKSQCIKKLRELSCTVLFGDEQLGRIVITFNDDADEAFFLLKSSDGIEI